MTVPLDFSSISPWNHPRIQFDEEFLYLVISRRLFSLEKIWKKGSPKENGKVFQAFLFRGFTFDGWLGKIQCSHGTTVKIIGFFKSFDLEMGQGYG